MEYPIHYHNQTGGDAFMGPVKKKQGRPTRETETHLSRSKCVVQRTIGFWGGSQLGPLHSFVIICVALVRFRFRERKREEKTKGTAV